MKCPDCEGDGYQERWRDENQNAVVQWPCERCNTTGEVSDLELEDQEASDEPF